MVHERLKSDNVRKCDAFSVCMVILLSVILCLERSFCHPNPCLNGGTCSQSTNHTLVFARTDTKERIVKVSDVCSSVQRFS